MYLEIDKMKRVVSVMLFVALKLHNDNGRTRLVFNAMAIKGKSLNANSSFADLISANCI